MRRKKNTIYIQVNPNYEYDAKITSIGEPTDLPCCKNSMWAWINHLREKTWWGEYRERSFIKLANEIIKNEMV